MIQQLNINNIRNLSSVSLSPSHATNVLYGLNGSGKTSVLEAIHFLGLAKSFRTTKIKPLIKHDADVCTVFAKLMNEQSSAVVPVGISRSLKEESLHIKLAGERLRSASELAQQLPLQVINPDTFKLLEGAPQGRRNFIDWGVFHVKHRDFFPLWKRMHKALKQRNGLLRHGRISGSELSSWNTEFIKSACAIDVLRKEYVERLIPVFKRVLAELTDLQEVSIQYFCGWDRERDLLDVLHAGLSRDIQSGYTHAGPQRADLRVRLGKLNAADVLSRGQLKLVVCALKIAQGFLFRELSGRQCVFLVDDLPSELDLPHREALCYQFQKMKCQTFITCVDKNALETCWLPETVVNLFHVKHGQITLDETFGRQQAVPKDDGYIRQSESLEIEHE